MVAEMLRVDERTRSFHGDNSKRWVICGGDHRTKEGLFNFKIEDISASLDVRKGKMDGVAERGQLQE